MYCNDADGLFGALGLVHNTEGWRLYIDLSKVSFKAVRLHSGNIYPSVPLAHTVHLKSLMEVWVHCSYALTVTSRVGRYVDIWMYLHCCYSSYNGCTGTAITVHTVDVLALLLQFIRWIYWHCCYSSYNGSTHFYENYIDAVTAMNFKY